MLELIFIIILCLATCGVIILNIHKKELWTVIIARLYGNYEVEIEDGRNKSKQDKKLPNARL